MVGTPQGSSAGFLLKLSQAREQEEATNKPRLYREEIGILRSIGQRDCPRKFHKSAYLLGRCVLFLSFIMRKGLHTCAAGGLPERFTGSWQAGMGCSRGTQ